jgi:hypothetical protein
VLVHEHYSCRRALCNDADEGDGPCECALYSVDLRQWMLVALAGLEPATCCLGDDCRSSVLSGAPRDSGCLQVKESPPASTMHALDLQPLRRWDTEEVVDQLRCVLEVVAAESGDPLGVAEVLDPRLQRPVEGHQAHEGQRGQQDEPEGVEGRAGVGGTPSGAAATSSRPGSPPSSKARSRPATSSSPCARPAPPSPSPSSRARAPARSPPTRWSWPCRSRSCAPRSTSPGPGSGRSSRPPSASSAWGPTASCTSSSATATGKGWAATARASPTPATRTPGTSPGPRPAARASWSTTAAARSGELRLWLAGHPGQAVPGPAGAGPARHHRQVERPGDRRPLARQPLDQGVVLVLEGPPVHPLRRGRGRAREQRPLHRRAHLGRLPGLPQRRGRERPTRRPGTTLRLDHPQVQPRPSSSKPFRNVL